MSKLYTEIASFPIFIKDMVGKASEHWVTPQTLVSEIIGNTADQKNILVYESKTLDY